MLAYEFATDEAITCCSKCPMLSYDSRACGLGMDGSNHDEATSMLGHPEWLFDRRPGWCGLHRKGEKCG